MILCDIHCHILPGVDDGSKTMEETMQVLQEAVSQGIHHMIVTPHFYPGQYTVPGSEIRRLLYSVQRRCLRRRLDIQLYPGQECYYYSGLTEQLNSGNVLTLADSKYVLVEFEPDCIFSYMIGGLRRLRNDGYIPILAHFERYSCLYKEENLMRVKQEGTLLQMNFDTLMLRSTLFRRYPWKAMVQQGMVDYLGSDCHGMHFRPLHVRSANDWIDTHVDQEVKRQMQENIRRILN